MSEARTPSARRYRLLLAAGLAGVAVLLCAAALPRDTLWAVENTCMLNTRTTGAAFPCLQVDLKGGFAVLRAPFRQTHVVTMPTQRVTGIESPLLRGPDVPNYFAEAWTARRFVQDELRKPLGWADVGLAVNSRATRSQDQLHIHVECVQARVKAALAERAAGVPTDRWQEAGFTYQGQPYWLRRLPGPDLAAVNPFRLADEIPALAAKPALTILAAIGLQSPDGQTGFMLMAGQSSPTLGAAQSTSEDLLDHACRKFR